MDFPPPLPFNCCASYFFLIELIWILATVLVKSMYEWILFENSSPEWMFVTLSKKDLNSSGIYLTWIHTIPVKYSSGGVRTGSRFAQLTVLHETFTISGVVLNKILHGQYVDFKKYCLPSWSFYKSESLVFQSIDGRWILIRQHNQTSVRLIFYWMKGKFHSSLKKDQS